MSSYIIAGSADNPETGLCEHIANEIKSYYQNIDFRIIIKHPKEWDNFIHEILRIYGFKKMYDPIVYTLDGKLIGGLEGFRNLAENGFGIDTKNLTIEIVPEINMKIVEKEVAQKKKIQKGKKTLEEKIALSLKTKLQDGEITCIEGYYKPHINSGMLFYVKQESKLCPEIFIPNEQRLQVVEEQLEADKLNIDLIRQNDIFTQETQPAEEEQKDDSKVILENSKQEVNQSELEQSKQDATIEKQGTDEVNQTAEEQKQVGENSGEQGEGQTNVTGEEGQQNQSLEGQEGEQAEGTGTAQQTQEQILIEEEPEEEDLVQEVQLQDNSSNLVDLNQFLIKKFKDEYYLAFHPEPLLDGQIILFEKVEKQVEEQKDNEILVEINDGEEELDFKKEPEEDLGIYISDWSSGVKHRKLKKNHKKKKQEGQAALQSSRSQKDGQQQQQQEVDKDVLKQKETENLQKSKFQSKLNRDIVELDKPLSKNDWKKIKKLLKKLDCAITLQILPFGHKNHLPLSNNVLNVYLREFLIRANQNKGIIEVVEDYNKNEQELDVKLLPFEKYILDLEGQAGKVKVIDENFIQIPNLDFDHLIYMCQKPKQRKAKLMKKRFKEMIKILYSEEDLMKFGINLIVTSQFLMLVPLRGSYGEFEGKPLYLNPISYLGYIHVPIMTKIWPNTAYKVNSLSDDNNYIKMLNNQIFREDQ